MTIKKMAEPAVEVSVTRTHTLRLDRNLLMRCLIAHPDLEVGPEAIDAEVTITVPRGGDYSGDSLDLDECGGLVITWMTTD